MEKLPAAPKSEQTPLLGDDYVTIDIPNKEDHHGSSFNIFGQSAGWGDWTAVDDRVRGGSSQSHLTHYADSKSVLFHGLLDITTLGGAGFASQVSQRSDWDLSGYEAIRIGILPEQSDNKTYTLVLKDALPGRRPDGRLEASTSWECMFKAPKPSQGKVQYVTLRLKDFKATYRGRKIDDRPPLKVEAIKQISLMMRSNFGKQEGHFRLGIASMSAHTKEDVPAEMTVLVEAIVRVGLTALAMWMIWYSWQSLVLPEE
ncbi:CIA30-domain-containing protein [Microthyrium microscopicum]|uniref:CIA30-domain-containing protein n=1 Tax=Microthyrium microscopicum TaxID=703497 RepID=A0A6A6UA00_9PEZI|nr:CIA30-domain-containing protein [Microthyrium microscopicum]